ncbi:DUF1778 domain-containing protein [Suipraeoptans intestinalis]|uniref:DUF1778 domain-containing protein n=1 Tax=Suipraeoptans intestinalis TaxID=2606628 RepID=A0A6N7UU43_9FIRM|nr:DUF1778 domain-containing protein [Suipraeoptans intestinalis]MDD7770207.1 DUF1778 domain-containing protein [Suipraeoptans intestinalis]MDY3122056.1 DUF1778 domain-containing protein [Suipraeoptans intestinalis]MSR94894.1 DUF1778 domain-containing protein [Suipraeoptans intestinalis]
MEREKTSEFDQIKYQNEYNKKKYDKVSLMLPKGEKETVKKAAQLEGKSMNEFIVEAVYEKMGKERK